MTRTTILQTRPQGEKSAERALEARGVPALRPREIVETRKRAPGGKQVVTSSERNLLPGYLVTAPATADHLDNALADMALREPRRDVLRVVGWASDASMQHVLARHGAKVERDRCAIEVGKLARVTEGAFSGLSVRVMAMRAGKAYVECGKYRVDLPLDALTPLGKSGQCSG